nr:uncharacterized protein LOC111508468 [Leptinotarsa decemlineata]
MILLHLIHTGLSFVVSFGSFVAFTIFSNSFGTYHGLLAATADGFCFVVVYFYHSRIIEREEVRLNTINSIKTLSVFGFVLIVLNLVQFIFRLTNQLRYEPALFPISTSNFFDILICAIGLKSGICLVYYCLRYRPRDEEEQPLLGEIN